MAAQNSPVTVVDAGPGRVSRSVEVGAPASELFAIVADPRRHHELDGSGTVADNISAPAELTAGSRFSTKMRMFGVPYRITSTVTALTPEIVSTPTLAASFGAVLNDVPVARSTVTPALAL